MYSYNDIVCRSRDTIMREVMYFATGGIERRNRNRNRPEPDAETLHDEHFTFIRITPDGSRTLVRKGENYETTASTLLHIQG